MCSILIVDNDVTVRTDLAEELRSRGHRVDTVVDAIAALDALSRQEFDVILADGETAGFDGGALLRDVLRQHPAAVVALTTLRPAVAEAVDLVRAEAWDFLARRQPRQDVEVPLEHAAGLGSQLPQCGAPLQAIWGSANPQMARAIAMARQVASSDVPVLLTGESGTGKKMLAAAIHDWSLRRPCPFVTVWCAALGEHHLGTGLREHLEGAVTGMRAEGNGQPDGLGSGTLFFDEVGAGTLPAPLQMKLLHHLESLRCGTVFGEERREISARIIAATRHDLEDDVRSGRLRKDLFFHLNAVTIALPPLRERGEDLPILCDHFLRQLAARHGRRPPRLTPEAESHLARYEWPGNVRELFSVLERAVVLSRKDSLGVDDLFPALCHPAAADAPAPLSLVEVERHQIALALEECATMGEAATRLGIDPATLWRKRKRYGLDRRRTAHGRGASGKQRCTEAP